MWKPGWADHSTNGWNHTGSWVTQQKKFELLQEWKNREICATIGMLRKGCTFLMAYIIVNKECLCFGIRKNKTNWNTQIPLGKQGWYINYQQDTDVGFNDKSLVTAFEHCEQLNSISLSYATEKSLCPFHK